VSFRRSEQAADNSKSSAKAAIAVKRADQVRASFQMLSEWKAALASIEGGRPPQSSVTLLERPSPPVHPRQSASVWADGISHRPSFHAVARLRRHPPPRDSGCLSDFAAASEGRR